MIFLLFISLAQAGSFSTGVIARPALPNVSAGAGTTFTDPAFGSRMVRVTDGNTMVGSDSSYLNRAFATDSSSEANIWSANSDRLLVIMSGGYQPVFTFNSTTMVATRVPDGASVYGGRAILGTLGGEPLMSLSDNDLIYGTTGWEVRKMVWGTWTPVLVKDFTGLVPDGTSLNGMSAGSNERICTYGTSDIAHWVAWFDLASPGTVHLLNTLTDTIDGVSLGFTVSNSIHNARFDKSGRYISVSMTGGGQLIWDTQTNAATLMPYGMPYYAAGHKVGGWGYFINNDDLPTAYQFQLLLRPLNALTTISTLLPVHGAPYTLNADSHWSWNNAVSGVMKIVFGSTNANTPEPSQPYMSEIIGVYTDGTVRVERFAHHRSTSADFNVDFESQPRGNISPNGRFFAFTSNWESTLGTGRRDVFIAETLSGIRQPVQNFVRFSGFVRTH